MRTRALLAVIIGAGLWLGAGAHAQQPAQQPAPAPAPPPEYGLPLTNAQARDAAAAALAEAKTNNWRMAVAVVGPDGELLYFERMDGTRTPPRRWRNARRARPRCFAVRPRSSSINSPLATPPLCLPRRGAPDRVGGRHPIVLNGKLVGAIGASSGTGAQDGVAAMAGRMR
jgi:uncharacterized protein GlcG (DUF336 family)